MCHFQRKRNEDMEVDDNDFNVIEKDIKEEKKGDNNRLVFSATVSSVNLFQLIMWKRTYSTKKRKWDDDMIEKHKTQRCVIPSKENPPSGIQTWIQKFQVGFLERNSGTIFEPS